MKRWENREGTPVEDRLKDLQETLGLGNLVNNPIAESLPDVNKLIEGQPLLAKDGDTLHLVIRHNGQRMSVPFSVI